MRVHEETDSTGPAEPFESLLDAGAFAPSVEAGDQDAGGKLHDRLLHPHPELGIDQRDVAGKTITTLEGLGSPDAPSSVQAAFITEAAAQCGYCTNGMVMTATA